MVNETALCISRCNFGGIVFLYTIQVDFLKNAGLVDFSPLGMTITESGQAILAELAEYIRQLHGLTVLEQEIAQALAVEKVVIIPGDSETSSMVAKELGRAVLPWLMWPRR